MKLTDSLREFIDQPYVARIAVVGSDGYPHIVPIWYACDQDDFVFFSSRSARKTSFIRSNSKGAVTIAGEPYGAEGYLLKGDFSLEEDTNHHWMSVITHRYEPKDLADQHVAEWSSDDLVLIRFKIKKVIRV